MKKILLVSIASVVLACSAHAEIFNITHISGIPREITAHEKDSGKYLWRSTTAVSTAEIGGHKCVKITEDGAGQYGSDKKYRTWQVESIYLYENNTIIPQRSDLVFKDKDGVITGMLRTVFDSAEGTVKCKLLNENKRFDYKDGIIDKNGLGVALMNYPYDRKKDFVFPMLTNEPAFYNMTLVNKGIDALTVNGRTIECYKLQMIPDLGFLGIFAPFVPKTYFWYKAAYPHEFMRYEGLESGLNTPYIVMQAEE